MPPIGTTVLRSSYAEQGWSSWFGGFIGPPLPGGRPYAMLVTSVGSTGIFTPFNFGIKYRVDDTTDTNQTIYRSTFQPPVATQRSFLAITPGPGTQVHFFLSYYLELGMPLFLYAQDVDVTWANLRKTTTFVGPGPPPLPLLAHLGPNVGIRPFNRQGYNRL